MSADSVSIFRGREGKGRAEKGTRTVKKGSSKVPEELWKDKGKAWDSEGRANQGYLKGKGKARQGKARQGKARRGEARQGKARGRLTGSPNSVSCNFAINRMAVEGQFPLHPYPSSPACQDIQ